MPATTQPASQLKAPPINQRLLPMQIAASMDLIRNPVAFLEKRQRKLGDVYNLTFLYRRNYVLHHPDHARYVLQENHRNYSKAVLYEELKMLLGNGLLTSEGDFWLRQRRMMQPAFYKNRLAALAETMGRCTAETMERWKMMQREGKPVELNYEMMRLTLVIAARTLLGQQDTVNADVVYKEFGYANEFINLRASNPLTPPRWLPTPAMLRYRKAEKALNDEVYATIAARQGRPSDETTPDLLAMLLDARDEETGEGMTTLQLRDEVMTLLLAGHETSANALCWALYLLNRNPDAAAKLKAEVQLLAPGETPTCEQLMQLKYTRLVIDETLRLYPPAWIVGRRTLKDDSVAGFRLKKGSDVIVPILHIHRDGRFWERPLDFWPERFLPENSENRHKHAYLPFGGGPRQCIGNMFAIMEIQIILAMLFRNMDFAIQAPDENPMEPLITLKPKEKMYVQLR